MSLTWGTAVTWFLLGGATPAAPAADDKATEAATVAAAGKVVDLAVFPLMEGADKPPVRRSGGFTYQVKGSVPRAFEFHQKKLTALKFKELPGGYSSEQSASGTFLRDGFRISVTVFDAGMPGLVSVSLANHGNVDVAKLPVPKGATSLYAMPVSAAFVAKGTVADTERDVRQLLLARGWQPYGTAEGSQFFKQNAVRLQARVAAAPGQGGKPVIEFTSELMSADLPAPPDLLSAQYSDSTKQLLFDTRQSLEDVVQFYREALGKAQWEPTLDHSTKSGFKQFLIFRNPQKDLIELEAYPVEEKLRVTLRHQTAAEVAEAERLARAALEKKKRTTDKPLAKLSLLLPGDAQDVEATASRVEYKLAAGGAKKAVEGLRQALRKEGWKETEAVLDAMAGTVVLSHKDGPSVTIVYVDPGVIPAEITISASKIELDLTRPEKE
jgi:hypothetical protein